ncbi:putative F-box protein At1g12855 [Lolium rigidum]|uniref:putative F-box protein At1g12855 n=1 Tax=Lolium rigidum TaxID=89674 RepID=UPI001F5C8891|nr:putative F-box protein At1g12855 [Lolium rigidum]
MGLKTTNKALRSSATVNTGKVLRRHTAPNKPEFMSTRKRFRRPAIPEMPDDLVSEILVRLPVKSLLRFKSVCRTWHTTICSRSFISMHLQRAVSNHQRHQCFLLTPYFLAEGSSNISLYRWQKSQASASLAYTLNFFEGASVRVYILGHCNGLVLVPTSTKMYVLNPSTRELLTLPESIRSMLQPSSICRAIVGFGLDSFTNKYKIVRFFNYSLDEARMGMEICTISETGRAWRSSDVDPPYPLSGWQTATFFRGSLFWRLDGPDLIQSPEGRLLRFCLKEEVFSLTMQPPCPDLDHDDFALNVLDGEMCLAQFDSSQRTVLWMTSDAVNPQWYRRCILNVDTSLAISISHCGVLLVDLHRVFQYDFQSKKAEDVAHLDGLKYDGPGSCAIKYACQNSMYIGVLPCIESLVPIAIAR